MLHDGEDNVGPAQTLWAEMVHAARRFGGAAGTLRTVRPLQLLTVCTGNICRSPVAERALQRQLRASGVPAVVRSAGTHGGLRNDSTMVRAAREAGHDLSGHVSRPIDRRELEQAQLVIAMDRGHIERIVPDAPNVWPRIFTLAELVRRASALPAGTRVGTFDEWVQLIGDGRTTDEIFDAPATDDVADPHGHPVGKHRAAVERIDELTRQLVTLLKAQVDEIAAARKR